MLHLERKGNNSYLALQLRHLEPFWTKRLCLALLIALLLHGGVFLVFFIRPFQTSSFIFPPVIVHSQPAHFFSQISLLSNKNDDETLDPFFNSLDFVTRHFQPFLSSSHFEEEDFIPSLTQPSIHWLEHLPTPFSPSLFFQLHVSGELAQASFIQESLSLQPLPQETTLFILPSEIVYQVIVDDQSGEIFWYDLIQSSQHPDLDRLAEQWLLKLKFKVNQLYPVGGTITFLVDDMLMQK